MFVVGFYVYLVTVNVGKNPPNEWIQKLMKEQWPAFLGLPFAAGVAFCLVTVLEIRSGKVEFKAFGLDFTGPSGPVVLWVLCFLAMVGAYSMLWKWP